MRLPKTIKIYGDITHRDKDCRKESTEQKEFFGFLKELRPAYHAVAFHPKNEGKRTYQQAEADRQQGALNKGASDIIIPASITFVCELKCVDHTESHMPAIEVEYLEAAQELGAFACIALGSNAAWQALLDWENLLSNK